MSDGRGRDAGRSESVSVNKQPRCHVHPAESASSPGTSVRWQAMPKRPGGQWQKPLRQMPTSLQLFTHWYWSQCTPVHASEQSSPCTPPAFGVHSMSISPHAGITAGMHLALLMDKSLLAQFYIVTHLPAVVAFAKRLVGVVIWPLQPAAAVAGTLLRALAQRPDLPLRKLLPYRRLIALQLLL